VTPSGASMSVASDSRRNSRVHCITAPPEDVEPGLRRQRLTGRDDPVPRHDLGAMLSQPALRSITGYSAAERRLRRGIARLHR